MELFFLALLILLMAWSLARGFPVAFALPGAAVLSIGLAALTGWLFAGDSSAYFHQSGPVEWLSAGVTNLRGIYWEVERDTLIAIPLFIFMGLMLQRSKIAEDLLLTMASLFGPIPGGLGISVVFVGALLAATTGILGATVVSMGLISLPAMLRKGYSPALASGTIAASGTLGQIIPPSIVLIILADQLASAADQAGAARSVLYKNATGDLSMPSEFAVESTSAGEMFLGAVIPGLVLVGLYMAFILITALLRPSFAPAAPHDGKIDHRFLMRVLLTLIPPLGLIFMVLGSIIAGVATVNQAGAIGAVGALIMAGYRLREGRSDATYPAALALVSIAIIVLTQTQFDVNVKNITSGDDMLGVVLSSVGVLGLTVAILWSAWRTYQTDETLTGVMIETAKTTSLVFIILLGAAMLTAAFRAFGGEDLVRDFLTSLPGGFWTQFVIVMLVIFLLGFFLDFIEIAVVVVPIVAPILLADPGANVTAVWLGVMIGLNMQTSFLTPPFGFALFYLRGVAPKVVKTLQIYKGVVPFICLQLVALGIVGLVPQFVNYLPNRISLTSSTAPPPINPKLQYCVDAYSTEALVRNGDQITAAVNALRTADWTSLPESAHAMLAQSLRDAESAPQTLIAANAAEQTMQEAAIDFRPVLAERRQQEADLRALDAEIRDLKRDISRGLNRIAELNDKQAERSAVEAEMPETWEALSKEFRSVLNEQRRLQKAYHREADRGYEAAASLLAVISSRQDLAELRPDLTAVTASRLSGAAMSDAIKALVSKLRAVPGTSDLVATLTKMRRNAEKSGSYAEMTNQLKAVSDMYDSELVWRRAAEHELLPKLVIYEAALRSMIGLRKQRFLTHEQALYVASCKSGHRDLALYF